MLNFMYLLGASIPYALIAIFVALLTYYFFAWKLVDKPKAQRIGICVGILLFALLFLPTVLPL